MVATVAKSKAINESKRKKPDAGSTPKKRLQAKQPLAQAWTFPKNTLEEAIAIPKAIEEKHGGNPMGADLLVIAVGFNKSNDWRFLDLLKSANMYGLVSGSGKTATVTLEEIGQDVVAQGRQMIGRKHCYGRSGMSRTLER